MASKDMQNGEEHEDMETEDHEEEEEEKKPGIVRRSMSENQDLKEGVTG